MTGARLWAIAAAEELDDLGGGARLAYDVGKLAAACRTAGATWALWLRGHGDSAPTWRARLGRIAYVPELGGELGISLPADGARGFAEAGLHRWVARVHVPAGQPVPVIAGCRIAVACHGLAEADLALQNGADWAVLSPIWPTASKPQAQPLGVDSLQRACAAHPSRIVALGGIDAVTAPLALVAGAAAVAALRAWRTDPAGLAAAMAATDPN